MGGTPQAFLSYTRLDDQGHDGGITALRAALELQVRIVTGDDSFEIFQDVDGIAFGEHWPKRLDQALAACRFLIPVLSPRFFKSAPCRAELRTFLAHEQAAGRDDLILPIYLVEAPVLERPHLTATDELAAAIAQRQRWDWRPHVFAPANGVRRAEGGTRAGRPRSAARLDQEAAAPPLSVQPPVPSPSATRPTIRRPGEVFRDVDEPWCPELVVIPSGSFTMGSPESEVEPRRDFRGSAPAGDVGAALCDGPLHGHARAVRQLRGGREARHGGWGGRMDGGHVRAQVRSVLAQPRLRADGRHPSCA